MPRSANNVETLLDGKARDLAAHVRRRDVSAREVAAAAFVRIHQKNPTLSAFVELDEKRALRAADAADKHVAKKRETAALVGVPSAIKDHEHMKGLHTRVGSRALSWLIWPTDSEFVKRCRDGGLILCGKVSTSELGILPYVHPSIHPPTRHPLDDTKYAGGSSGGTASAIASGMMPIGPGSDGAGSIRIPAAYCGLVGWKPSRHVVRNPHKEVDAIGLATSGPLARDVRDAAVLLDVLAGHPEHHAVPRDDSYAAACEQAPKRLRIRFGVETGLATVEPEVKARVRSVARKLEELGHIVEEGEPLQASVEEFIPLMARLIAGIPLLPMTERLTEPVTQWLRERGKKISNEEMWIVKHKLDERVMAWFSDADVWLLPTSPHGPQPVGTYADLAPEALFFKAASNGVLTAPFNVTGQPAASIPAGRDQAGMPIGVQLVGRLGSDRMLFGLAAQLEGALASSV